MNSLANDFLPKCNHCEKRSWKVLCSQCDESLRFRFHCIGCGIHLASAHSSFCCGCRLKSVAWKKFHTSYFYEGGVKDWILDMKEKSRPERLRELKIQQLPKSLIQFSGSYDFVVSVPSDPAKTAQRSFVFSDALGTRISRLVGSSYKKGVFRRHEFLVSQKNLSRSQRRLYLQKCLFLSDDLHFKKDCRVLLVDDVLTTGVSLNLCAGLLSKKVDHLEVYSLSFQIKKLSHLAISDEIGKTDRR